MENLKLIYQIIYRITINIIAIAIASFLFKHVEIDSFWILVLAAIILTIFNLLLKPILMIISLPVIMLTLGVGYFIINALILLLVSYLLDGFYIDGFWVAIGISLFISIINVVADTIVRQFIINRAIDRDNINNY